jgi:CBS domain containing-hemolysin-like protein
MLALLLIYLLIALAVSFLCSMLEASLLSVQRSHVAVLVERGSAAGRRLERMKDDVDRPLAAILTLNTFAHTLGAAGVGAQATALWGEAWVGAVSVVVTLLILIFSEIIPKTLGAVHAKGLAPFTAWTVHILILGLYPVVWVCNWLSKVISGGDQPVGLISRDEVRSMARMAQEEGAIDAGEAHIIRNLIALREIAVVDVMTPRTVVFTLPAERTVREVTAGEPPPFARIPVLGTGSDDVIGMVPRHEIYKAAGAGRLGATMGELARPLHIVPESARLPAVLDEFLRRREQLFLVVDEYGGVDGIITLEDVIETLLGVEIVDEADPIDDMRALAKRRAEARRRRL